MADWMNENTVHTDLNENIALLDCPTAFVQFLCAHLVVIRLIRCTKILHTLQLALLLVLLSSYPGEMTPVRRPRFPEGIHKF